jgi:tRNA U38,U39,U40 pseudouridine synthase TruA
VLELRARSLLHHQVRRTVGACRTVARGELDLERVDAALAGGELGTYEVAPHEGLVLWRAAVGADWRPLDEAEGVGRDRPREARERPAQRSYALAAVARPISPATRRPRA